MRAHILAPALLLAVPAAAQPATAADGAAAVALPQHRLYGRLGALAADANTKVRIDVPAAGVSGTLVDFEDDFGLGSKQWLFAGEFGYRFDERWRVEFEFWTLDRSASRTLDRSITIDGTTYDVGASGRFASSLYNLDVHWTPIHGRNYDLGFSLGAHVTDFLVGVEGEATVGETVAIRSVRKTQLAPLPTIGTNGRILIAPRLMLMGAAELFALEIDGYKGRLVDAELGLVWAATRNIGIGASYRTLDYRLTLRRDRFTGRVEYGLDGPSIFVTVGF